MKLLVRQASGERSLHCVALFGGGLIGSWIEQALHASAGWTVTPAPYHWLEEAQRRADNVLILRAIQDALGEIHDPVVDIIWAAGVSGFGSSPDGMAEESGLVAEISALAECLAALHPHARVRFHLLSSAGGLFEGQTIVGAKSLPAPMRAYGEGKLRQEEHIAAMAPAIGKFIYRPTSVYGFRPGARRGMFATLMLNALANRPTTIQGTERTLRDYVYAEDVGNFIAGCVMDLEAQGGCHVLGSGKPTSMFEVISCIEDLLQRRVYRRYEALATNAVDCSFAQSNLPSRWVTTPLKLGLRRVHDSICETVVCHPAARAS